MTDILIVIQARTGSVRFPGKVMQPLSGEPLLMRMLERVSKSKYADHLVVATTWLPHDDIIVTHITSSGYDFFRGHPDDLLDRHYQVACDYQARHVVKIPSDCPLIDFSVIDFVIDYYLQHLPDLDYAGNVLQPTWPDGNDVEIFSFDALEYAYHHATEKHHREHTTPFIYENTHLFKTVHVLNPEGDYELYKNYRLTLDYPEDYQVIRHTFENLYPHHPDFGWKEIVEFLKNNPEINAINSMYHAKSWMNDFYKRIPE